MEGLRTYVVATAPGRDYRVRDELIKLGYAVWLPECTVKRKLRGTVSRHKGPLFPGYQFIELDLTADCWRAIEDVRGVEGLLKRRDTPLIVPAKALAELRQLYGRGGGHIVIEAGSICREFEIGQMVEVVEGPFTEHKGVVSSRVAERVKVLLDILGRQVETELSEAQLTAA